jgi:hypothetical protein
VAPFSDLVFEDFCEKTQSDRSFAKTGSGRMQKATTAQKRGVVYLCRCCLQVFDDKAFAEWLVTNFGTGAALYGQTNASVPSFDTVGTLLKTYASLSVHLEPVLANDRIPPKNGKA